MSDDELRDELGAHITDALNARSQPDTDTSSLAAVQQRVDRRRSRRRLLTAALVIAVVAAAVPVVIGKTHDSNRVRTVNPSGTTIATVPKTEPTTTSTTSTSTTTTSTTTTVAPPPSGPIPVTEDNVGTLRFGVATKADVIAVAGPPAATVRGSFGVRTLPGYLALGYECSSTKGTNGIRIGPYGVDAPPYCRTVYYLNVDTSTLAGFATTTDGFATLKGTTVGMATAEAAAHEGKPAVQACFTGIEVSTGASAMPSLFVFVGTHPSDRVSNIAADHSANSVGVLFC